jgi:hypothetical protein
MATAKKIKLAGKRIAHLVETLADTKVTVRGSFSTVHRRCGKPNCWCAEQGQKGHVCTRITWTENGISRTKTVKAQEQQRLQNAAETYRTYRRNRRKLRAEEKLLEKLLDLYESDNAKFAQE